VNYKDFLKLSMRQDTVANDNVHFFAKHFSKRVAYLCFSVGLTPNGVTWLFLLVGLFSGAMFYQGFPILGYFLWRLHIILDMADGDLARGTRIFSNNAVGFDRSNHIIINSTIIFAFSSVGVGHILTNVLLVAFYLYYFFSRNYVLKKPQTQLFSKSKNFFKNAIGFEGFIMASAIVLFYGSPLSMTVVFYFYSVSFIFLFLIKLHNRLRVKG
jgi:phosphatidylglycerophosphate synthase